MGFTIRRVDKTNNESSIESIHEDYHNGDCTFLSPMANLETLSEDLKYLVIDFSDHLILIYPQNANQRFV
jgi:hypothetical protein